MLKIERTTNSEIIAVKIGDEELESDDGESWTTPRALLRDLPTKELPPDLVLSVCERIEEGVIVLDGPGCRTLIPINA